MVEVSEQALDSIKEMHNQALKQAYLLGFLASGKTFNAEFPFDYCGAYPENDKYWCNKRDKDLGQVFPDFA